MHDERTSNVTRKADRPTHDGGCGLGISGKLVLVSAWVFSLALVCRMLSKLLLERVP